jgi:hypothetical protein
MSKTNSFGTWEVFGEVLLCGVYEWSYSFFEKLVVEIKGSIDN